MSQLSGSLHSNIIYMVATSQANENEWSQNKDDDCIFGNVTNHPFLATPAVFNDPFWIKGLKLTQNNYRVWNLSTHWSHAESSFYYLRISVWSAQNREKSFGCFQRHRVNEHWIEFKRIFPWFKYKRQGSRLKSKESKSCWTLLKLLLWLCRK